jgi:hypothetical protein|tara:strand:+ start:350 stop:553 length:204 start_codon:yes stop_codon:yes gene_type:complete
MTVEQLIEKLQTLNPNDEVLIEINHDELVSLREDNEITIELVTEHNRIAFEDEDVEGNVRRAAVIRA